MALAQIVDTLDSVPEAARGAYVKQDDGKFKLDFEVEDVSGLKNALTSERNSVAAMKKQISEWQKLGKAPDEIDAMLRAEREKAEAAELKAGKFDDVLNRKLSEQAAGFESKLTGTAAERDSALGIAKSAIVENKLGAALIKGKASAEGMSALPQLLGSRVKIEFVDGKAVETILDANGEPMLGSGKNGVATFDDLVKEAVKSFPSLFEGTGAGGSGTDPKGQRRDAGGKTMQRADFDKLSPADKTAKMRDGWTLFD